MTKYTRHILFWAVIYVLWSYMKSNGTFWVEVLKINILNVGIYMAAYYSLRHIQLPLYYNRQKQGHFFISLLFSSIIFYMIWRIAGVLWIDDIYFPEQKRPFMDLATYLTQTVQFYSPAVLLFTLETYHERQEEKIRLEQLEKEKIGAELKFLKAQINPHFLFNTLNNLYSYVVNQSPKAPDMIMHLSGMLDYVLYRSREKTVALREEIETIHNFTALEKIRYGERLKVEFAFEGNPDTPVSPLILLSLVENAFKHGASGDIDFPKIKINITEKDGNISCEVWNTKSKYRGEINDEYKKGIGLSNIKRQLNLIYQNRSKLIIKEEANSFFVSLNLKHEEDSLFIG